MFKNRKEAGKMLSYAIRERIGDDALVLGIPKGGIEVGLEIAKNLEAEYSNLIVLHLAHPQDRQRRIGAVAEDGSYSLMESKVPSYHIKKIIREQLQEIRRMARIFRDGPVPNIKSRKVIIVDDGIETGETISAAIKMIKKRGPSKIIVAAPICGVNPQRKFPEADESIVLESPEYFLHISQGYKDWHKPSDIDAIKSMNEFNNQINHMNYSGVQLSN